MNGGEISGNTVYNGMGGGICINSNTSILKGGIIEENFANNYGGGIYVHSYPYTLAVYDAAITGNQATSNGGGMWSCPTGNVETYITHGVALYDNTADEAGADLATVRFKGSPHNEITTLFDRMLSGGKIDGYKDGRLVHEDYGNGATWGIPDGNFLTNLFMLLASLQVNLGLRGYRYPLNNLNTLKKGFSLLNYLK